jgi:tRNA (guanine-N(7)-)-methyltransferase subunit TRM82
MKQLIHHSGPATTLALNDQAFTIIELEKSVKAVNPKRTTTLIFELCTGKSTQKSESTEISKHENEDLENHDESNNNNNNSNNDQNHKTLNNQEIQAVSSIWFPTQSLLICAISRQDKTLSLYQIALDDYHTLTSESTNNTSTTSVKIKIQSYLNYHLHKRACTLTFTSLPISTHVTTGDNSINTIIIVGDLAGDAIAYSTNPTYAHKHRLLLGHTASMLTSVFMGLPTTCVRKLITADRDEKIRISSFPQTFIVDGYLLGHSEYITDAIVLTKNYHDTNHSQNDDSPNDNTLRSNLCLSCSGDGTIKLWNYTTFQQLACVHISIQKQDNLDEIPNPSLSITTIDDIEHDYQKMDDSTSSESCIPVRLAANSRGTLVAVMYHDLKIIHIFKIQITGDNASLELLQTITSPSMPLGLTFTTEDDSILVLMKEPNYIVRYCNHSDVRFEEPSFCNLCDEIVKLGNEMQVTMPETLLELDKTGKVKLVKNKLEDAEGFVKHEPWLNVERIDKAKERNRRHKKRKKERLEGIMS